MSKKLNLGCGTDTKPDYVNVDVYSLDGVDRVVDLNATPWPWDDDSVAEIHASHVFEHLDDMEETLRECARVLEPNGTLRVIMPMGVNAIADPDHANTWTYQTPEFYTGKRHWDSDIPLHVTSKAVDLHSLYSGVANQLQQLKWSVLQSAYGTGEWCLNQPAMSGEFTTVFKHTAKPGGGVEDE